MNAGPHRHFHDELARLKESVLFMSGRAEDSLSRAVEAFLAGNALAAQAVVDADPEIDSLEVEIEETVTNLLALHQPVAKDLRLVLSALKISNDLERVADHAVNIAKAAERISHLAVRTPDPQLVEMTRLGREMLATALRAFVKGDGQAARHVCAQDDEVDALHRSLFQLLMTRMAEQPEAIDYSMELMLVSRNIERVGDMATNIAEEVVYLVEGTTIKHGAEKKG
jgi:phosphate transport system protein